MSTPAKIHFVSLVSVDHDIDMLPYFIPHYSELGLDNYCLFLHEGKDTDANLWAEKAAKDSGWRSRFVPREASFSSGELKRVLLNKFQKACKPGDYIVCADGDEIQKWTMDPREVADDAFDMVLGRRADRFNEKLVAVDHTMDLEDNYPLQHDNLSKIMFPKKPRPRDKIVMARANVPVDYRKCMSLTVKQPGKMRITEGVGILHYKWRDGIFRRLRERPDYLPDEIAAIRKFFEVKGA